MTIYETVIPAGKIKEADLMALVEQVRIITKTPVSIQSQFVVQTEDVKVCTMLDSLVEALPADQPTAKKNGKTKIKKPATGFADMTSHQVRIETTGEIVSRQAFNKKLEAGEIAEMTEITNAKGETFVVIDRKLAKGPQS
jgi:hypothetical protein